jgi:hypothetical protein
VNNKRTLCYAREQLKKVIWTAVIAVPLTLASFSWVSHPAAETSVAARTLLWPIEGASALANTPAQVAKANGSPASEEYPAPSPSIVDEARADESKVANRKIYNGASTESVPSKFQYLKPFSKEWNQRREEEARRLKAATTICRC